MVPNRRTEEKEREIGVEIRPLFLSLSLQFFGSEPNAAIPRRSGAGLSRPTIQYVDFCALGNFSVMKLGPRLRQPRLATNSATANASFHWFGRKEPVGAQEIALFRRAGKFQMRH